MLYIDQKTWIIKTDDWWQEEIIVNNKLGGSDVEENVSYVIILMSVQSCSQQAESCNFLIFQYL
jgi:hypothetical protein